MKKVILLIILLLLVPCLARAEFRSVSEVSDASLSQLEALHTQAEGQIVQNDFRGAIKTYEDILLLEPDDEVAYTNLGRIYMISGDRRKAETAFLNALHINPENEVALMALEKIKDPDRTTPAIAMIAEIKEPDEVLVSREIQIQRALKKAGLYEGSFDGKIGPASRAAIMRFQKFRGLKPDGIVGAKTWALLEAYVPNSDEPEAGLTV